MGGAQSSSNTFVAVDGNFSHSVYVRCDSESLKLKEMEQDYKLIFGGDLGASLKAKQTGEQEGPSGSLEASVEGKANFEIRTEEHSKFCAKLIQIGFSTIMPGEFLEFDVPVQNTSTVYITIYGNNHMGKYIHPLCVNLPKDINAHILVESNGQVVQSSNTNLFKRKEYKEYN